ncbi:hypothetical protein KUH03_41440 [Sphingobacterium sp. E70]|uniref:hypothetical protein n=1 Tax=Sphingobacterium sp. E70 TaxID=2853439 RepID=UPI00211CA7E3|nr:hypothetical protein [Sphingobacterium sp. E70]ULT25215.1 hypothetical protein KUH03_41440 [Sphingobacterium sp. E70]
MKKLAIIILLSLAACGRASSPEGRSKIRDENIQQQIEDLRIKTMLYVIVSV